MSKSAYVQRDKHVGAAVSGASGVKSRSALDRLKESLHEQGTWGRKATRSLLRHFKTAEAVLAATEDELKQAPGVGQRTAVKIVSALAGLRSGASSEDKRTSDADDSDSSPQDWESQLPTEVVALQAVARIRSGLVAVADALEEGQLDGLLGRLAALEERLAERFVEGRAAESGSRRVTVAVVGDFSSGKSTFINAIIGEQLCPVDPEPTTSSITYFSDGPRRVFELEQPNGTRIEVSQSEYAKGVAHGSNGPSSGTAVFHVQLPSPLLAHVRLIDTPGFNNPHNPHDTHVTEEAATSADALFVVFDINKGNPSKNLLTQLERLRLDSGEDEPPPGYLLLNQADKKRRRSERAGILGENERKHRNLFKKCLLVSSRWLANDPADTVLAAFELQLNGAERALRTRRKFSLAIQGEEVSSGKGRTGYEVRVDGREFSLPRAPASDVATRRQLFELVQEVAELRDSLVGKRLRRKDVELRKEWPVIMRAVETTVDGALAACIETTAQDDRAAAVYALCRSAEESIGTVVEHILCTALEAMFEKGYWKDEGLVFDDHYFKIEVRPEAAQFSAVNNPGWKDVQKTLHRMIEESARILGEDLEPIELAGLKRGAIEWLEQNDRNIRHRWAVSESEPFRLHEWKDDEATRDEIFREALEWCGSTAREFANGFLRADLRPVLDDLYGDARGHAGSVRAHERKNVERLQQIREFVHHVKGILQ